MLLEVRVFAPAMPAGQRPSHRGASDLAELVGFVFMVPLGLASAAAVMVGHAIGRGDGPGAPRAGWIAMGLGTAVDATSALAVRAPATAADWRLLARHRRRPPPAPAMLGVGAVFAVFDGVQFVAPACSAASATRAPDDLQPLGHWVIGLPIGWTLAFVAGWGVVGLWIGLSTGLIVVGYRVDADVGARRPGMEPADARLIERRRHHPDRAHVAGGFAGRRPSGRARPG